LASNESPPPLPGTRPEGAHTEREAAARVQGMFARIAPRYDFLNHLLSFSLDRIWRRRTAKLFAHILLRPDARVLDLCCGTGDLTFALERLRPAATRDASRETSTRSKPPHVRANVLADVIPSAARDLSFTAPIIGSDFVEGMLVRAREKSERPGSAAVFVAADVLHLPFPNTSFDLITTAFGFRNLANYEDGLREFARVLKPGGELGILEFTEPTEGALSGLFRFYFRHILPRIGKTISGDAEAYAYLPGSITKFPSPSALTALMEKAGFANVRIASWNFGTVLLHCARRV
jgi:demethylmenaquinone methyltransferase / 2-methoxy-6-polyprenyl-1,4-benzoquinol methylase